MKVLISITCIAVLAAVGLYFYRDHQAGVSAKAAEQDRIFRSVCGKTRPGEKWQSLDAMNGFCKEEGYID